jgi:hypothetical protein
MATDLGRDIGITATEGRGVRISHRLPPPIIFKREAAGDRPDALNILNIMEKGVLSLPGRAQATTLRDPLGSSQIL